MRFKDSQEQKAYLRHASQAGNVELVYAGLDVLGSTPWHINRQIFDVVIEVWNSGRRFSKMPPAQFDEPEPEKPDNYDNDMQAKSVHGQRLKAYQQDKANNHSDRCSVNYKIEIARAVSVISQFVCFSLLTSQSSSWAIPFIFHTTLTSVVGHIPFHRISTILEMI